MVRCIIAVKQRNSVAHFRVIALELAAKILASLTISRSRPLRLPPLCFSLQLW